MAGSDAADQPLEIACDESGAEGERLVGGVTDVFAHASTDLGTEAATACVLELRDRIRSPATEYKANHLLREKHRAVLVWLLGAEGPLSGYARVHLTEKTFFVVGKLVSLLVDDLSYQASRDGATDRVGRPQRSRRSGTDRAAAAVRRRVLDLG